ncbi:MAG: GGDEF domain-containing protein [Pseudonocardiales bacterium]|nr:MAG: GGDEF domain-containing protein [Pseudonocardiales bacterium]
MEQIESSVIANHTDVDYLLRLSVDGVVQAASGNIAEVLGWDLPRAAEEGIFAVIGDEAQRAALRALWRQLHEKGSARGTVQLSSRSGLVWLDIAAKRVRGNAGNEQVVHVSARDVTDDMAATSQLTASEREWRVAFEHSPIGGALLEPDGSVLLANDALCTMLGWRHHELSSMRLSDLLVADSAFAWQQWWARLVDGSHAGQVFDHRLSTSDGRLLWSRLSAAAVPSPGSTGRVMLQVQDITERRDAELQLANRALHDGLTELPNRFLTRQWLASALEENEGQRVGVLYCDLDRFKIVNDSLGHAAGDQLLSQVAARLRALLRPEDLVGRVGGDEFVMILEGVHGAGELADVAARVAEALDRPFDLGDHLHAMTLSIGGALGAHPHTTDELLMRADMALLRAKRLGRARFELYDPSVDHVATREDLQLEDDLRLSVASGELRAYYQPIVSLSDHSVAGHEALLRWQHPEHGLLPPAHFLELAESSGLIRPLGWWILTQACRDAAAGRHGLGSSPSWVAVNASPSQLARPGMANDVTRALVESGLRPERLHLEITETALITAGTTLLRELRQLTEMGVRIALDDFGTGYSSLSLLRQFPVDVVKIDRSFIEPLLTDRTAHAIVKAVLGMCRDMGLRTVAEGIEREDQRDVLLGLGCSHGQGYLFGHPRPLRVPVPLVPAIRSARSQHKEALA